MKNLKKLFVVLPLVLVMLLSVVPVLAEPYAVKSNYVSNAVFQGLVDMTKVTKEDVVEYLKTKGTLTPVWVGENIPFADSNFKAVDNEVNDRHMNVVLMNGGAVHGWIPTNYDAVAPLSVAQNYVAANLPGYVIPSYQIQNVMYFEKIVKVPENWLELGTEKVTKIEKSKAIAIPEEGKAPTFVKEVADAEGNTYAAGTEVDEADRAAIVWDENVAANAKVQTGKLQVAGKFDTAVDVQRPIKVLFDLTTKETTQDKEGRDNVLADAKITGLLIIVEKADIDVAVTHHFVFADGTEIVQTANQKWAKTNGDLTIAKVDPTWYMAVPGFTIDTTKTAVAEVRDEANYLVLGEKVLKSYKVDLYYTAGEGADKAKVDAAFAGNTANVANAQQLPATGAADSFALVLSSLALVVVGLFLKK